jgi:hypothetical protein
MFLDPTPLLEEERGVISATDAEYSPDPFDSHRTRARAAFSADDHPVDAFQIEPIDRTD